MKKFFLWLTLWGITFGYIEAAIVIYIREIYYPNGFQFPVILAENHVALVEIIREAMTLIILWMTAQLTRRTFHGKLAFFMFLFGVWDIVYYIVLKIFLGWPDSLATWDILFLLPFPWVGPVWAPVVVSIALISVSILVLTHHEKSGPLSIPNWAWVVEIVCGIVIIISFLIPGQAVIHETVPTHYPWYLFWSAYLTAITVFLRVYFGKK